LYYIFPEDLSHSLCVFDGLLGLDAAGFETAVLVE
jgi:hypothetical protein